MIERRCETGQDQQQNAKDKVFKNFWAEVHGEAF